ncbi:GNAT domain-containing protein [Phaeosphaeria sp. MPI-PUGE-AT-0046c]|nr:GNAT domain-containing protein [Phaeosphaeria sp. MPI-PUGE-AT-0046c]
MADSDFYITTPRLYISHHNASNDAHCDCYFNLIHSPSSKKFNKAGPSLMPSREAARSLIEANAERMQRTSYGRYIVSLRPDEADSTNAVPFSQRKLEFIGAVSMQHDRFPAVPGPLIPDLGFNFLPQYHGKGYATEAATHLMRWFKEEKGAKAFAGITDDENEAAKKALTKLGFRNWGMRRVKGVVDGGEERELSVWTIGVDSEESLGALGL